MRYNRPSAERSAPNGWGPLQHVFSFEVIFAAFVYAMFWKGNTLTSALLVDMTPVTASLSVLAGLWLITSKRVRLTLGALRVPISFLLLAAWASMSLLWTRNPVDGPYKAAYMLVFTLWCGLAGTIIGLDQVRVMRYAYATLALALAISLDYIATPGIRAWPAPPTALIGCGAGAAGQIAGTGMVCLWCAVLHRPEMPVWARAIGVVMAIVLGYPLLQSGQRGPLLFLSVLPIFTTVTGLRAARKGTTLLGLGAIAGIATVAYAYAQGSTHLTQYGTFNRLTNLEETGGGGRTALFATAVALWKDSPWIGQGLAGFSTASSSGYVWAHNIILESLSELGIVGFLLLSLTLVSALQQLRCSSRRWADPDWVLVIALLLYTLLLNLKSGDLVGAKWMWAAMGMTSVGLRPSAVTPARASRSGREDLPSANPL